jgi:hypothetical protein
MSDYTDLAVGREHNRICVDIARGLARRYEVYLNFPLPESMVQLLRKLDPDQPEGASSFQAELEPSGPGCVRDPGAASEEP